MKAKFKKHSIKLKFKKSPFIEHLLIIIIICLIIYFFVDVVKYDIKDFKYWIFTQHGNIADWITSLCTAGAFIWGITVFNKQTNTQRAIDIENSRPRFSFKPKKYLNKGDILLFDKEQTKPKVIVKKMKKKHNHDKVLRLTNISQNKIYTVKII